jgi:pSer/pThr/pTyr-binding forkhead associated (FHA) protein
MPFLKYTLGGQPRLLELTKPVTTIGRSNECDVPLDDTVASRKHCVVRRVGDDFVLEDLKSRNGTLVNGAPVSLWKLSDGDEIAVGQASLVYRTRR